MASQAWPATSDNWGEADTQGLHGSRQALGRGCRKMAARAGTVSQAFCCLSSSCRAAPPGIAQGESLLGHQFPRGPKTHPATRRPTSLVDRQGRDCQLLHGAVQDKARVKLGPTAK